MKKLAIFIGKSITAMAWIVPTVILGGFILFSKGKNVNIPKKDDHHLFV